MRTYSIYRNTQKERAETPVSIELVEGSFFHIMMFTLHQAVLESCHLWHHVMLPKWLANWEREWGCECKKDEQCDCWSKFSEYFGKDWGSLWHCYIEMPLSNYMNRQYVSRESVWVETSLKPWDALCSHPDVNWIREDIEREKNYGYDENGCSQAPSRCWYPGNSLLFKIVEFVTRPWRTPPCDGSGTKTE